MTEPTNAAWRALVAKDAEEFRSNNGKVGGRLRGHDVLILTTRGARSGQPRTVVLVYFMVDGRMLVVGSKGGAPQHPSWVHNLRAHPRAHVEVGSTDYDVAARELQPPERQRAYDEIVGREPRFGEYQAKTTRVIPVFELRSVGARPPQC